MIVRSLKPYPMKKPTLLQIERGFFIGVDMMTRHQSHSHKIHCYQVKCCIDYLRPSPVDHCHNTIWTVSIRIVNHLHQGMVEFQAESHTHQIYHGDIDSIDHGNGRRNVIEIFFKFGLRSVPHTRGNPWCVGVRSKVIHCSWSDPEHWGCRLVGETFWRLVCCVCNLYAIFL